MAETKLKTYSQFLSITENKQFVEFLDNFISTIKKQEIALKNEKEKRKSKSIYDKINIQHSLPIAPIVMKNDRVHPLNSIDRINFIQKNDSELDNPIIHYGSYSNELTKSLNLLAMAIGNHIYFRNGAYKPETEEGRALLSHELTHVSQHTEKRINNNSDNKILENEAEYNENKELYENDPIICKNIYGVNYKIRKSKIKEVILSIKSLLNDKIESYCNYVDEETALKTCLRYKEFLDNNELEKLFI